MLVQTSCRCRGSKQPFGSARCKEGRSGSKDTRHKSAQHDFIERSNQDELSCRPHMAVLDILQSVNASPSHSLKQRNKQVEKKPVITQCFALDHNDLDPNGVSYLLLQP